jgi:hypothetical protein
MKSAVQDITLPETLADMVWVEQWKSERNLPDIYHCISFVTETFWHNPQYCITLEDPDDEDEDNKCTVIVGLMQKNHRSQRKMGMECLTIGFAMYHVRTVSVLIK